MARDSNSRTDRDSSWVLNANQWLDRAARANRRPAQLGERGAAAVRDAIIALGVAPERLTSVSHGRDQPVRAGRGEEVYQYNRRVEFIVDEADPPPRPAPPPAPRPSPNLSDECQPRQIASVCERDRPTAVEPDTDAR